MIIRMAGFPPIRGRQPLYFMDDVFLARAKIPAPLDTDRIGMELTETTVVDVSDAMDVGAAAVAEGVVDGAPMVEAAAVVGSGAENGAVSSVNADAGLEPNPLPSRESLEKEGVEEHAAADAADFAPGADAVEGLEPDSGVVPEPAGTAREAEAGDGNEGEGVSRPDASPVMEGSHEITR